MLGICMCYVKIFFSVMTIVVIADEDYICDLELLKLLVIRAHIMLADG